MKLPAKVEYAFKAVIELAARYSGESPIQLNVLSESQGIPKKFLIQLLLRMKSAGLVNSLRGTAGGYYLARPPSKISLADVLRAIDDSFMSIPNKTKSNSASDVERLILRIWGEVSGEVTKRLELVTLERLAAQIKNEQLVYYI